MMGSAQQGQGWHEVTVHRYPSPPTDPSQQGQEGYDGPLYAYQGPPTDPPPQGQGGYGDASGYPYQEPPICPCSGWLNEVAQHIQYFNHRLAWIDAAGGHLSGTVQRVRDSVRNSLRVIREETREQSRDFTNRVAPIQDRYDALHAEIEALRSDSGPFVSKRQFEALNAQVMAFCQHLESFPSRNDFGALHAQIETLRRNVSWFVTYADFDSLNRRVATLGRNAQSCVSQGQLNELNDRVATLRADLKSSVSQTQFDQQPATIGKLDSDVRGVSKEHEALCSAVQGMSSQYTELSARVDNLSRHSESSVSRNEFDVLNEWVQRFRNALPQSVGQSIATFWQQHNEVQAMKQRLDVMDVQLTQLCTALNARVRVSVQIQSDDQAFLAYHQYVEGYLQYLVSQVRLSREHGFQLAELQRQTTEVRLLAQERLPAEIDRIARKSQEQIEELVRQIKEDVETQDKNVLKVRDAESARTDAREQELVSRLLAHEEQIKAMEARVSSGQQENRALVEGVKHELQGCKSLCEAQRDKIRSSQSQALNALKDRVTTVHHTMETVTKNMEQMHEVTRKLEDNEGEIRKFMNATRTVMGVLQVTVTGLQADMATLQKEVASQRSSAPQTESTHTRVSAPSNPPNPTPVGTTQTTDPSTKAAKKGKPKKGTQSPATPVPNVEASSPMPAPCASGPNDLSNAQNAEGVSHPSRELVPTRAVRVGGGQLLPSNNPFIKKQTLCIQIVLGEIFKYIHNPSNFKRIHYRFEVFYCDTHTEVKDKSQVISLKVIPQPSSRENEDFIEKISKYVRECKAEPRPQYVVFCLPDPSKPTGEFIAFWDSQYPQDTISSIKDHWVGQGKSFDRIDLSQYR